jgi:UDP-GlcNAc3NAcA epimerase
VNDAPGFVLATIHRAENTDDGERLRAIFEGLASSGKLVVLPLHPRTRAKIEDFDLSLPSNILAIPPVGYLEMIWLEMNCAAVATDSGGMQKEAYFFGKPCVTLRDETEWSELVEAGCNRLVGADRELIAASLQNPMPPADALMLYGDGTTAERIVSTLLA